MADHVRFWMDDPNALLDSRYIRDMWPEQSMTFERKLNAITRTIVTMTLVGASLVRRRTTPIMASGMAAVVALAVLHYLKKGRLSVLTGVHEGMANVDDDAAAHDASHDEVAADVGLIREGGPSAVKHNVGTGAGASSSAIYGKNPFHNVLVPEYGTDAAERPRPDEDQFQRIYDAVKSNAVEVFHNEDEIEDEDIKSKLFQSLGDNYTFENSMRNYVTNPSISVAGDQDAFANYCYGDMCSTKEMGIHPS